MRACENAGGRRERAGAKAQAAQGIAGMHGRAEQRARRVREWIGMCVQRVKSIKEQSDISSIRVFACPIALFAIVCGHMEDRYFTTVNRTKTD